MLRALGVKFLTKDERKQERERMRLVKYISFHWSI